MIRIVAPHFTAGVVLDARDRVTTCAPIVRYMRDWHMRAVLAYCQRRGWRAEVITSSDQSCEASDA